MKDSASFRVYIRQTTKVIKSVNVLFDEISGMVLEKNSLRPALPNVYASVPTTGGSSSTSVSQVSNTMSDLDLLFERFYSDYFGSSSHSHGTPVTDNQDVVSNDSTVHVSENVSDSTSTQSPPNSVTQDESYISPAQPVQSTGPSIVI